MDLDLRAKIIADPSLLLEDKEVMRALVAANDDAMGENVVDLRGLAMERLEARLDRLEEAHRSVIAAAYENLAGTNLVHRAVLRLLEAESFPAFLGLLSKDIPDLMRIQSLQILIEGDMPEAPKYLGPALMAVPTGQIEKALGRNAGRTITLEQVETGATILHGPQAPRIRSQALLTLDLGPRRRAGLLVLGSDTPHHFAPPQGTELLSFFGASFERLMRRWLG